MISKALQILNMSGDVTEQHFCEREKNCGGGYFAVCVFHSEIIETPGVM